MGFFKRLFSADYRAAVAAEASGDLELAAERYALAGQLESAVRVHMARADRGKSRADEIQALRDALHWVPEESELRPKVVRALGHALLSRARAEGVATRRDRERVREAARLLAEGGEHRAAGDAYESLGDDREAAAAYRAGGLVNKMEAALSREDERGRAEREVNQGYADYELAIAGGDRDGAVRALRRCVEAADRKAEYRRLLDDLESRLITSGRVVVRTRRGRRAMFVSGDRVLLGRDPLCDIVLRSGGVSRHHAEVLIGGRQPFALRDAGSRNGTLLGGMQLSGIVPLEGKGHFGLGDDCAVQYTADDTLTLAIEDGLDKGTLAIVGPPGRALRLPEHADIDATLSFRDGRPILHQPPGGMMLNGERIAHGDVQLIHGDTVAIGGVEIEVQ